MTDGDFTGLEVEYQRLKRKRGTTYSRYQYLTEKAKTYRETEGEDSEESGLSKDEMAKLLSDATENQLLERTLILDRYLFEKSMKSRVKEYFRNVEPLNTTTANKCIDSFNGFFKDFEHLKEILTTKDYIKADVKQKVVNWGIFTFSGNQDIKMALMTIETTMIKYLTKRDLLGEASELPEENYLTILEIWIQAVKLAYHFLG